MYITLEACDRQTERQNCHINISSAFKYGKCGHAMISAKYIDRYRPYHLIPENQQNSRSATQNSGLEPQDKLLKSQ